MKGMQLTKCVFHSGKCLYRLLACACRSSISNACNLSPVSNVEKFLHGNAWLRNRMLVVEQIQPICQPRMDNGDEFPRGPSVLLKIEQNVLRVTHMIGEFLCPVKLQTVLKILNPIGHSWNMQDEDSDSQDEYLEPYDADSLHRLLGHTVD